MSALRVFVGTDRSQQIAVEVLKYTIAQHSRSEVKVEPMLDLPMPQPVDMRQSQRTGFSFSRWAVPGLSQHQGKAIYLDADMMLFTDIQALWDTAFEGVIANITPDVSSGTYQNGPAKINKNETSVTVFNCEKFSWSLEELVAGLDGKYLYEDLMFHLCFLKEDEISRVIPRCWNSLDYWDESVKLLHYTNTLTQPWVSNRNQYAYIWVEKLKEMLVNRQIDMSFIENEISLGYVRPSLKLELEAKVNEDPASSYADKLSAIDRKRGYVMHKSVQEWKAKRYRAIKEYRLKKSREKGFFEYYLQAFYYRKTEFRFYLSKLKSQLLGN